jgi:hypothetical protein
MTNKKLVCLLVGTALSATVVASAVFSAKRQLPQKKWPVQQPVTSMPPVYSHVKSLEVVRTWIEYPGTPHVSAAVEIRNNSNKDVLAVDLMSGEGGITRNGLTDEDHPIVVMKPGDTTTLRMNFGAMTFGVPLVVSGVVYGDGTEEGDTISLKSMHHMREHDRAQLKAKKDAQKGAPLR